MRHAVSQPRQASNSRINRAGEALVDAFVRKAELPISECSVVGKWRELHAEPLAWLTMSVRRRSSVPVAYRLKRLPQIVAKLARQPNMALARMQDIGGCRLVVEAPSEVDLVRDQIIRRSRPHYELLRESDYRAEGRPDTGYRALHLILRREGFQVEAQLRTRRQHAWAEAVERAANRTDYRLKDGEGPADLVAYFRKLSDCLSELDQGRQPQKSALDEVWELEGSLHQHLRELPPAHASGFAVRPKSMTTKENSWLLVYNWRSGEPTFWMDCGTDARKAAETYSAYEFEYPWQAGFEVVLIGSDSKETIEWTHAHYFGRSPDDLDPHGVLQELRTL